MSNVKTVKTFTRYQTHLTNEEVSIAKLVKAVKQGSEAIKEAIENQPQ